jgi:hypothetical protein
MHTSFRWVNVKDREHLKDLGGDGRIILKMDLQNRDGGVDWFGEPQGSDQCWFLVNMVMNLRVP